MRGMQGTKVFLNGRWIGVHRAPDELKKALLKLRRAESISNDVSIVYDHSLNEIRVNNDWGRVCRPLFVVEQGEIKLSKQEVKEIKYQVCGLVPSKSQSLRCYRAQLQIMSVYGWAEFGTSLTRVSVLAARSR